MIRTAGTATRRPAGTGLRGYTQSKVNVLPALALLSVTFVPMVVNHANPLFVAGIFLLSLYFLYCAARLALTLTSEPARRLLFISVFYLPLIFVLQICAGV